MSGVLNSLGSDVSAFANQPAPVVLGPLTLTGVEAPSRITIGGKQLVAIHKLPGGARVIDAMGPDDNAVAWQGIFIGPAAASRIRLVDSLRSRGQPCMLAFGDYLFEVIVIDFQYSYQSRGTVISYRIRAEKTKAVVATTSVTALDSARADCSTAVQFLNDTQTSIAAYGGVTGGLSGGPTSILAGVLSVVTGSGSALSATDTAGMQSQLGSALLPSAVSIQDAIPALSVGNLASESAPFAVTSGGDLISTVQTAGALAGVVSAGGLINRASGSLATADAGGVSTGFHS